MNHSYIYLIKVRKFNNCDNIYKIGKTTQHPFKRIKQYNKDSEVICIHKVNNCHDFEKSIIEKFDILFTKIVDIGKEYYLGDEKNMVKAINDIYSETEKTITTEEILEMEKNIILENEPIFKFLNSGIFKFGKDRYVKQKKFVQYFNVFMRNNNLQKDNWDNVKEKMLKYRSDITFETTERIDKQTGRKYKATWIVGLSSKVNPFFNTDYTIVKGKMDLFIENGQIDESKLIEYIHYNDDYPENKNIRIKDNSVPQEEAILQIYDGFEFVDSDFIGSEGFWDLGQHTLIKTRDIIRNKCLFL